MSALIVKGLMVSLGGKTVLDGIDLEVGQGEIVVIAGTSGCGKTTLLDCINGIIPHFKTGSIRGSIIVNGVVFNGLPPAARCRQAGTVLQDFEAQMVHSRVDDELAFGPENLCVPAQEIVARVEGAASLLSLNSDDGTATLSGGNMQSVCIGGALTMEAALVLLDEPFSNIDTATAQRLIRLLDELRSRGHSFLIVEHRIGMLRELANRVLTLANGRLHDGSLEPAPLPSIGHRDHGAAVLEMDSVSFAFRRADVLKGASLSLHKGESVVLTGDNGAGKTTLLRLACGDLKPRSGSVQVLQGPARARRLRGRVGLVWQNPSHQLFMPTVHDEVAVNCGDGVEPEEVLREFGLWELRHRHPLSLSGGERRRLALAATLAGDVELLLLDEPTLGQDRDSLGMMMRSLQRRCHEGMALLTVTHDDEVAGSLGHRELTLRDGMIFEKGQRRQVGQSSARSISTTSNE